MLQRKHCEYDDRRSMKQRIEHLDTHDDDTLNAYPTFIDSEISPCSIMDDRNYSADLRTSAQSTKITILGWEVPERMERAIPVSTEEVDDNTALVFQNISTRLYDDPSARLERAELPARSPLSYANRQQASTRRPSSVQSSFTNSTFSETSWPNQTATTDTSILDPDTTRASPTCACHSTALSLFEKTILEENTTATHSISDVLQAKKAPIKICKSLLQCLTCMQNSGLLIMLIQICQKNISSYRDIPLRMQEIKDATEMTGHLVVPRRMNSASQYQRTPPSASSDKPRSTSLILSNYPVSSEEKAYVLRSLILFQLRRWEEILGDLSKKCSLAGLQMHSNMVGELESGVRVQIRNLGV